MRFCNNLRLAALLSTIEATPATQRETEDIRRAKMLAVVALDRL
jgi:hypothetical protein